MLVEPAAIVVREGRTAGAPSAPGSLHSLHRARAERPRRRDPGRRGDPVRGRRRRPARRPAGLAAAVVL